MQASKRINRKEFIYHVIFWVAYLLIWSTRDTVRYPDYFFRTFVINGWQTLLVLPFVYLNLYYFLPRFLLKNKFIVYVSLLGILMLFTTFYSSFLNYHLFNSFYQFPETADYYASVNGQLVLFTDVVVLNFSAMSFVLFRAWFKNNLKLKMMEKEKLESELKLLKQQIQPHFIFNTLNTIYMLMQRKEKAAKDTLMNFSEILSHQLYETQKEYICLKKEIEYLKSYFEIEKIRQADALDLKMSISHTKDDLMIAPMLLVPFVENAFKHGSQSDNYWIDFKLNVEADRLYMFIANSNESVEPSGFKTKSGIGLRNVKKRLDLMYSKKYLLKIDDFEEKYQVRLELDLSQGAS